MRDFRGFIPAVATASITTRPIIHSMKPASWSIYVLCVVCLLMLILAHQNSARIISCWQEKTNVCIDVCVCVLCVCDQPPSANSFFLVRMSLYTMSTPSRWWAHARTTSEKLTPGPPETHFFLHFFYSKKVYSISPQQQRRLPTIYQHTHACMLVHRNNMFFNFFFCLTKARFDFSAATTR